MSSCRICQQPLQPFLNFGPMPIANGFLTKEEFASEYFYDLEACFCERCTMVQLRTQPEPEKLFHASYPFLTGTSKHMEAHFTRWAEALQDRLKNPEAFVVEIGSNDGTMLRSFAAKGIRHLGIDPSQNVSEFARENGVQTLCGFFNEEVASLVRGEHGSADLILAANVMCHIPDLHAALEGIRMLLKPEGWFVFEEPYAGDVLEKTAYDQFYDEHVFMFSLKSLQYALNLHELEIFHVEPQWTHGGSLRYYAARRGAQRLTQNMIRQLQYEETMGLSKIRTYASFAARCQQSKHALLDFLHDLNGRGKRLAGYAATSKSTTVLNYCGITPDLLPVIYDTTPLKQGKFSPGTHIPVEDYAQFKNPFPDYSILFAWNHAEEIFQKEKDFRAKGGRWVLFVPEVKVL